MRLKRSFLILAAGTLLSGCHLFGPSNLKFSGTLEMTEHSVGARVPGRLTTLNVQEGDTVQKGQRIGTLDRFEQAKKDYERAESVHKSGGVTDQALEHAKLDLEDQEIVSPVDGVVLTKVRETGEIVPAGGPVADLGDSKDLWVRIYVPEGVINKVRMGQSAEVRFDGLKKPFNGRVSFIAPRAEFTPRNVQTSEERVTQTFAVKVAVDDPDRALRPGVSADVTLN